MIKFGEILSSDDEIGKILSSDDEIGEIVSSDDEIGEILSSDDGEIVKNYDQLVIAYFLGCP